MVEAVMLHAWDRLDAETAAADAQAPADPAGAIAMVTLDDEVLGEPRIDVIKIDVEGWELEVLRGAERVLRRQRGPVRVQRLQLRAARRLEPLPVQEPMRRLRLAQRLRGLQAHQIWHPLHWPCKPPRGQFRCH